MSADTASTSAVADETMSSDQEPQVKLNLDVNVETLGACQRRVKVTIPPQDIERYFDQAIGEVLPKAAIPGFRIGKAPRKLVESRFRKDVAEQVKGQLLMDSIAQATDDQKLSAISEPDLDLAAIELPNAGPLTFEFKLEVRPEFDMPQWRGLHIDRPVREFTPGDIDQQLKNILRRHGRLVPHDNPAQLGDYLTLNITFSHNGQQISQLTEQQLCLRAVLSLRDGRIDNFGQTLVGAVAGDKRQTTANISGDAPNEALRGRQVDVEFEVLDLKKLEIPDMTPQFLRDIGDFRDEQELRDFVLVELKKQLTYYQRQKAREQITAALTASANWELPPDMLRRQSYRELQRQVLELQRNGFTDDVIKAHENNLRQNVIKGTARAIKEHFILERLAEDEKIEDTPDDYEEEIRLIAQQTGESVRRVRARLEKRDMMDILRNQIIERKAIDLVLAQATFKDVPFISERFETEAVDESATGTEESEIPDAVEVADNSGPAPGMKMAGLPEPERE
ncbi:MAG: trigger factor [Pirellulales bacterium]|nr:trigger factor [Pirellulales bacterium]